VHVCMSNRSRCTQTALNATWLLSRFQYNLLEDLFKTKKRFRWTCVLFRSGSPYRNKAYKKQFSNFHRETDRFFAVSGVQSAQSNLGATCFHFRCAAVLNQLKSKCGLLLGKTVVLRVTLNLDGAPIVSHSHTHPSHSQTSRLLTLSLSLGVPVPRPTQCM
jgi:hypothetical protein